MPEEDRKPGPWSIGKSIVSGEPKTTNLPEPEKPETIAELTEKDKEDMDPWVPGIMKPVLTMRRELAALPDIQKKLTNKETEYSDFTSKAGYSLSLGLKEKEIFFFGGMQWLAVAIAYLLWTQMLFWIPPDVWEALSDEDGAGPIDFALIAWAFVCVGVAAFPIGIFSGCMGVTHFLHKQGRASTVAMCLKLSLPNAWPLWAFHWTDGWITVRQIMSRLPRDNDTL